MRRRDGEAKIGATERRDVQMKRMVPVWGLLSIVWLAGAPGASASMELRIQASYTEDHPSPDAACGGFALTGAGTASGDAIGAGTWTSSECVDVLASPGAFTIRDGNFTIAVADGALHGTYSAKAGVFDAAFDVYPSGDFVITSGSGIWAGASGDGIFYARVNAITGTTTFVMSGTLTND
jgi:hypothetical protein